MAAADGVMRVLTALPGDAAIVVSATDGIYEGAGDLTVDLVRPGQPGRRWIGPHMLLVDAAPIDGGGVDLLAQGSDRRGRLGPLSLLRVAPDGSVRRTWQTPEANIDGSAAVARAGSRTAIAWVSRGEPPVLHLATACAPGEPLRETRVVGVLPSWVGRSDPSYAGYLDIALDSDGRVTFALTPWRRRGGLLVLASVDEAGHLLQRQSTRDVEGLVELHVAPGGRTAVVAEDTGIEGEVGECVEDGFPRVIRAAIREPGAARFQPTRVMHRLEPVCDASSAQLLTDPGGRLALLWGVARDGRPKTTAVRVSLAPPGQPFGPRIGGWPRVHLLGAAFDAADGLFVFGTRRGAGPEPFLGPLVVQRLAPDGTPGASQVLDRANSDYGLLTAARPDGKPMVAWTREDETRRLAVFAR